MSIVEVCVGEVAIHEIDRGCRRCKADSARDTTRLYPIMYPELGIRRAGTRSKEMSMPGNTPTQPAESLMRRRFKATSTATDRVDAKAFGCQCGWLGDGELGKHLVRPPDTVIGQSA